MLLVLVSWVQLGLDLKQGQVLMTSKCELFEGVLDTISVLKFVQVCTFSYNIMLIKYENIYDNNIK